MEKLWSNKLHSRLDPAAEDFNSSIRVDSRMVAADISGSIAHTAMLSAKGILPPEDAEAITMGLADIAGELASGRLRIDCTGSEDIHSFIEAELTRRIGDAGRRLHTARSRNDQVALDLRLHLRDECRGIKELLRSLITELCSKAEIYAESIMPGYTHLQRAQPVTLGFHLMAYAMMFIRDMERVEDCVKRVNISPLGSCALAGTTFDTDRELAASLLYMDGVSMNAMDGVSDRDFAIELASCLSIIMMHLSRLCEELILWCSWEFRFITLPDSFSTGSSIMPQKKNPDIAELIRDKTGRVYGDLMALLTLMKGLPLAYNKDMQEDKEAIFDAADTVKACLSLMAPMIRVMQPQEDNMRTAAAKGFINATDCADYLTAKGMPFRTAYRAAGDLVAKCIKEDRTLETLTLEEYREASPLFDGDIFEAVKLENCVQKRGSLGGTSPERVKEQIAWARGRIQ